MSSWLMNSNNQCLSQVDRRKKRENEKRGKKDERVSPQRVGFLVTVTIQSAPDPEKEVRDRFDLTGKSPYTRWQPVKQTSN